MADQQLEDIEFRQDFIEKDSESPLHLIREKEMEITGRVLKAKREAEDIVADARRKAAESVSQAEEDGAGAAKTRQEEIGVEFDAQVEQVGTDAEGDLKAMKEQIATAMPNAVKVVVEMVTDV